MTRAEFVAKIRGRLIQVVNRSCAVTPHYSVVGEAPLRISDVYEAAEDHLRGKLRFVIVLREPVARTISSWEYKSKRETRPFLSTT